MPQDQKHQLGSMAGVGLQIGVGVGLGCLVGWWLDKKYGWSPWESSPGRCSDWHPAFI